MFNGLCDWLVVVILEIEHGQDERAVGAEERRFIDDQLWSSRFGSHDEDVEHVTVSVRWPNDVLHEIVVIERAQEFDRIGVVHHVEVDVDIPTIAIADENVAVRSSASSNSSKKVLLITVVLGR